ncbi:MAG: hypothetical protein D6736_17825 [Nitrospinota bacterium]|nr:MAG: hypothetical protein D6736_17825 [Nitrospinota bacterium]
MDEKQRKERLRTIITAASERVWGVERTEALQPTLEEMVDQLVQVTAFPLALEEEPAFFLR